MRRKPTCYAQVLVLDRFNRTISRPIHVSSKGNAHPKAQQKIKCIQFSYKHAEYWSARDDSSIHAKIKILLYFYLVIYWPVSKIQRLCEHSHECSHIREEIDWTERLLI